jgi:hypothetical protein
MDISHKRTAYRDKRKFLLPMELPEGKQIQVVDAKRFSRFGTVQDWH